MKPFHRMFFLRTAVMGMMAILLTSGRFAVSANTDAAAAAVGILGLVVVDDGSASSPTSPSSSTMITDGMRLSPGTKIAAKVVGEDKISMIEYEFSDHVIRIETSKPFCMAGRDPYMSCFGLNKLGTHVVTARVHFRGEDPNGGNFNTNSGLHSSLRINQVLFPDQDKSNNSTNMMPVTNRVPQRRFRQTRHLNTNPLAEVTVTFIIASPDAPVVSPSLPFPSQPTLAPVNNGTTSNGLISSFEGRWQNAAHILGFTSTMAWVGPIGSERGGTLPLNSNVDESNTTMTSNLTIGSRAPNLFADYRLTVRWAHVGSTATSASNKTNITDDSMQESLYTLDVPGYYAINGRGTGNSGNVWAVQFRPMLPGQYSYTVEFLHGRDAAFLLDTYTTSAFFMDGKTGRIDVRGSDDLTDQNAGKSLQVSNGYYKYSPSGNYFYPIGPALTYLLDADDLDGICPNGRDGPTQVSVAVVTNGINDRNNATKALEYLAQTGGANSIRVSGRPFLCDDSTRFNVSKLEQWRKIMESAESNALMIQFDLVDEPDLVEWKLYYREMVARFGDIIGAWGIVTTSDVDERRAYLSELDPYHRPINVLVSQVSNYNDNGITASTIHGGDMEDDNDDSIIQLLWGTFMTGTPGIYLNSLQENVIDVVRFANFWRLSKIFIDFVSPLRLGDLRMATEYVNAGCFCLAAGGSDENDTPHLLVVYKTNQTTNVIVTLLLSSSHGEDIPNPEFTGAWLDPRSGDVFPQTPTTHINDDASPSSPLSPLRTFELSMIPPEESAVDGRSIDLVWILLLQCENCKNSSIF
jgi:hypothetical protein